MKLTKELTERNAKVLGELDTAIGAHSVIEENNIKRTFSLDDSKF